MSWEEYKWIREHSSFGKNSSWEAYKRKREEEELNKTLLPTVEEKNNNYKIGSAILNPGKTININSEIDTEHNINKTDIMLQNALKKSNNSEKQANDFRQQQLKNQLEKIAQEKSDKINKDISNNNYMSAIGHILLGVPQKALDALSTSAAAINSVVDPKNSYLKLPDANELLKTNRKISKQYEDTTSQINSDTVQTAAGVSGTIGQMIPSIIANAALPGSGAIVQGVNVGADAYQDTLNENATNKRQATTTGVLKGVASALIEKISGGNLIGKGSLDDAAAKLIENKFSGKVGQKLASKAYEMIGEIGEENLENQVDHIIDKLMNNEDNVKDFNGWWNEAKETTKSTFLTTIVLNLLGLGGGTYNDVQDIKTQKFVDEAKKIIQTDLNNNTDLDIDTKINKLNEVNRIENISDYNNYTANEQKQKLVQQLNQDTNLDVDTKVELLNNLRKIDDSESFYNFLRKNNEQLKNMQSYQSIEQNNLQGQQSISQSNKMAQNLTSTQINDLMNNKTAPLENYEYIKSDNAKIDTLRQDANKYFVNNEKAKSYVNMLEKIIADKDVTIRLDPNLKDSNGNIANGSYINGVITINPNSTRAGEFIAIHELTHAIGTKEMLNIVNNYRESNAEFDLAVKKLLKNYDGTEISEEALSDVAGQLFGNQEFINNLAQNNPSMFRKIYNEIKYLWHQFTGYKNQNQFIEDLQYKWEQAYRNNKVNIENNSNMLYNANERGDINDTTRNYQTKENRGIQEQTQTELETRSGEIESNEEYLGAKSEAEQYIKEKIKNDFNFDDEAIKEIYDKINNKENLTMDDIYDAFDNHRDIKIGDVDTTLVETIQSMKKTLRNTRIDVSNIKSQITDWNDFRKKNFGKLRLVNDPSAIRIDSLYQELLSAYPGMLDENITHPADQLEHLASWLDYDSKELLKPEVYTLSNSDLEEIANYILSAQETLKQIRNNIQNNTKYSIQESENNSDSFNMQKIQGLENYDIQELKSSFKSDIQNILEDNGIYDVDIVDIDLHGSRLRGTAKYNSDLDVVVQYDGNIREDTLFDILNENPIEIDGIKVDINPIKENIKDYINRSKEYDQEILSKNKSSKDNKGRTLTKEQQNYFKDSKVRDNNGNLLTMYHSTDADFNTFTYDNLGKTGLAYGQGFYFTDSENAKNAYGKNTKTVYLDIQKPMEIGKRTMTEKDYRKMVTVVNEATNGQVEADYGSIDDAVQDYQYGGDDIDLINGLKNESGLSNKKFYDLLRNTLGYDGIKANNKNNGQDGNYWIAFNSNQIKNIDNTTPTKDNDIRYSKENNEWKNYLNNNFKNTDSKGRNLSKQQYDYFKDSKARDDNGNLLVLYHGTPNGGFNTFDMNFRGSTTDTTGTGDYGKGFYFTPNKQMAEGFSENDTYNKGNKQVYEVYLDMKNPLRLDLLNKISKDGMELIKKYGWQNTTDEMYDEIYEKYGLTRKEFEKMDEAQTMLGDNWQDIELSELGYDGIINENRNEYIVFNSNQIKNVDNTKPTLDSDIRYSKDNQTWQQYLEKNFKANGTRTNLKEINLPTAADIEKLGKNDKLSNKEPEIPKTKQDLLDNNSKAINKYIQEKNNSVRNISAQIEEYNNRLKSLQDKNSVEANKIKSKIIELTNKSNDIETLYNNKIDKAIAKGQKLLKAPDMTGRKAVIQKNRQLARERIENIADWKDKSNGFKYQRETMERNMFDIIPNKQDAQKMIDTYFEPVHESEANKQRFINKYNDKIKELNLNKYESEAVQLLGEEKYNPDFNKDNVAEVLDRVTKNINDGKINKVKVDKAIETFRSIYDELFDLENQALKENGYPEKLYRKGYFPHFVDAEPVSNIEKFLDKFGFKVDRRPLPTDIAGITEQFVPGKTWNRSALHRKTDTTTYNALKGFDTYISQAADNIFHTENIQKLRALENEIRYQYSEEGIQTRIDEIYNNDALTQDEQQAAIERIFEQVDNPMPNLVTELRRYTNALANKKSEADRSAEQKYGRQIYSTVNAIENRFGANAVGLNIGSAITNFIPITQAYSQVSTKNMGRAFMDTIKSYINDDGFTNNSTFLTNRLNQSEKLYKTSLEKISDKTSFLFNAIDNVASNIVVRGKYLQNLDEGMSTQEAMKNADRFGANLMADRSKGSMPTLFNEKSPISKAFTQFQLEVNNQFSYMFKDLPRDLKDKGIASLALAFFKMFIAAFLYNKASEEIVGRKSAFSPIDIAIDSYNTLSDENTSTADKIINVSKETAKELPFVGGFLGGGRIPVSGALPDAENTFKAATGLATGEMDSKKATNTLQKELSKPLYYLLPPFGGGQLKKTVEGVSTVANGGSYGVDSKGNDTLQFPVENPNAGDYLKAGLFGKYALDNAKEYANRGYKSLNAKQTQIYKEAKIPYKELLDYIDQGLTKKENKISYIEDQNLNENQKWGIYKYDILSSTERKDGGSQLSDAEYMINNGMTKKQYIDMYNTAQKNNIDIPTETEYKNLKQKGINISNYIDYKVNEKQYKNDKGELKDKNKIQILINSNYSNKETKAMYEELIKNANDSKYDILNKAGIDIKEYLKYKQQDFNSDKTKTYNYVNNMKINYNQKLLLLGMQYSLTSDEKTKLANYINTMNISKQDKLDIYSKIKGFKVYDDGRVTW